jgi:hypothetical protein
MRNVVVAMPFGSAGAERRKAILNFRRLKYIIENKCEVVPREVSMTSERVVYDVDVARTPLDDIPKFALKRIYAADILIVLLSGRNPTVTYELGYRRGRESDTVRESETPDESVTPVILIGDTRDDLPVYEASVAYEDWRQDDVLGQINAIAASNFPKLDDFGVNIPDALKAAIDAEDGKLTRGLELALQKIENKFVELSTRPVQKLRGMLDESIERFYPSSVVKFRFSKQGELADPKAPPEVVKFDNGFVELYGYGSKMAVGKPLTLDRLLNRIERYSDKNDWQEFMQEQRDLTETVIKDYGFARAKVPMRINNSHPYDQFRCKSFLPCMAARVIDGVRTELPGGEVDFNEPHQMYLLIAYIQMPAVASVASPGPVNNGTPHRSTRVGR